MPTQYSTQIKSHIYCSWYYRNRKRRDRAQKFINGRCEGVVEHAKTSLHADKPPHHNSNVKHCLSLCCSCSICSCVHALTSVLVRIVTISVLASFSEMRECTPVTIFEHDVGARLALRSHSQTNISPVRLQIHISACYRID